MKILKFIKKDKSTYIAKVKITDYDIRMFEDLEAVAQCYYNNKKEKPILKKRYDKWLRRQFRELQRVQK